MLYCFLCKTKIYDKVIFNLLKFILTEILSLAKNDIDIDISLDENDIDREGQQQDRKKLQICLYSQKLSLLLQRHPLFG